MPKYGISSFWCSDTDISYSSGTYAPFLAALAPGVNIIRMLLLGLGLVKNEAMVKSMSRSGDHRFSCNP
jgi:hypothetical protein